MADNYTLLGYLAPRIAGGTENAAVEALGYILNQSPASMKALSDLAQTVADRPMEPITRVETQVVAGDLSRPDFVGFDTNGAKRVIGEAKFWAGLGEGQAGIYLEQLADEGPAVLLFVVPDVRIDALWAGIKRDAGKELGPDRHDGRRRSAVVVNTNKRLMLVSWLDLLDSMIRSAAVEPEVQADIQQLRGLARREDVEAFMPLRREELGPVFARRMRGLNQLIDDVVGARGVEEQWMDTNGLRATPQRYGYGRYLRLSVVEGDLWFGVNHDLWATREDTPLWLWLSSSILEKRRAQLQLQLYDEGNGGWAPVRLKTSADYDAVLDDVASQLKAIADKVESATPSA